MTQGYELRGMICGGKEGAGQWGIKGRKKWDNCNSIINKIYFRMFKKLKRIITLIDCRGVCKIHWQILRGMNVMCFSPFGKLHGNFHKNLNYITYFLTLQSQLLGTYPIEIKLPSVS